VSRRSGHAERVIRHFDAEAARYRRRFSGGPLGALRREERGALLSLLDPRPGDEILDAGCGPGNDAAELIAHGCRVTGVDLSPAMVEQARANGLAASVADLHTLELGRSFAKIWCAGPLEFCESPERVLERLALHLAPGGRLVLLFPTPAHGGTLYQLYHRLNGFEVRLFSIGEMLELVRRTGLVGTECLRPRSFSMALAAERAP
jgi:SAM-dependent methyltransferase